MMVGFHWVNEMSNAPSSLDARLPTDNSSDWFAELSALVPAACESLRKRLQFAGFWSAVLLPLLYVPMLAGGLTDGQWSALAVLLAVHGAALIAGHGYGSD